MARTFAAAAGRAGLADDRAAGTALITRWCVGLALALLLVLTAGLPGAGLRATGRAAFAGCADLPPRAAAFRLAPGRFAAACRAIDFPAATCLPEVPVRVAAGFFVAGGLRAGVAFFAGDGFFAGTGRFAGVAFFAGDGFFAEAGRFARAGFFAGVAFFEGVGFFASGRDVATGRDLLAGLLLLAAIPALVGLDRVADFFISSASPTCPKFAGDAPHAAAIAAAPSSRPLRRDGGLL